mmetsp:Transcript_49558/g.91410  ORF Transcript_49558/g.91410 Transcript_49558/m.91410 type:complete len:329 (+) Transcript_49558:684-1670(+)
MSTSSGSSCGSDQVFRGSSSPSSTMRALSSATFLLYCVTASAKASRDVANEVSWTSFCATVACSCAILASRFSILSAALFLMLPAADANCRNFARADSRALLALPALRLADSAAALSSASLRCNPSMWRAVALSRSSRSIVIRSALVRFLGCLASVSGTSAVFASLAIAETFCVSWRFFGADEELELCGGLASEASSLFEAACETSASLSEELLAAWRAAFWPFCFFFAFFRTFASIFLGFLFFFDLPFSFEVALFRFFRASEESLLDEFLGFLDFLAAMHGHLPQLHHHRRQRARSKTCITRLLGGHSLLPALHATLQSCYILGSST